MLVQCGANQVTMEVWRAWQAHHLVGFCLVEVMPDEVACGDLGEDKAGAGCDIKTSAILV